MTDEDLVPGADEPDGDDSTVELPDDLEHDADPTPDDDADGDE